jgi:hypothetical protein
MGLHALVEHVASEGDVWVRAWSGWEKGCERPRTPFMCVEEETLPTMVGLRVFFAGLALSTFFTCQIDPGGRPSGFHCSWTAKRRIFRTSGFGGGHPW